MKKKKEITMLLLLLLLTFSLGIPVYAEDEQDLGTELNETVEEAANAGQDLAEQIRELSDTGDENLSLSDLQSLAEQCNESITSLSEAADDFLETIEESAQITGSIGDINSLTSSGLSQNIMQSMIDQLRQSMDALHSMQSNVDKVKELQAEQEQIGAFLDTARQLAEEQKTNNTANPMPDDMAAFFDSQNLRISEDWSENADVLEWCLEKSGTDTQQEMVNIQDAMGSYNNDMGSILNMMKGTTDSLQTLNSMGSIYSGGSTKLVTVPVITSCLCGVAAGMLVMYMILRKGKKKQEMD